MAKFRIDMISEEVKRGVDSIIRDSLDDPRIKGTFSITHADVTRDLSYAKIFVSVLETENQEGFLLALKKASSFIRRELGNRINIRYTPELIFVLDKNIEYGIHIAQKLREILPQRENNEDNEDNE